MLSKQEETLLRVCEALKDTMTAQQALARIGDVSVPMGSRIDMVCQTLDDAERRLARIKQIIEAESASSRAG